jgi:hypothetical protein
MSGFVFTMQSVVKELASALALIPMRVKNETMIRDEIMGQDKMQA